MTHDLIPLLLCQLVPQDVPKILYLLDFRFLQLLYSLYSHMYAESEKG